MLTNREKVNHFSLAMIKDLSMIKYLLRCYGDMSVEKNSPLLLIVLNKLISAYPYHSLIEFIFNQRRMTGFDVKTFEFTFHFTITIFAFLWYPTPIRP